MIEINLSVQVRMKVFPKQRKHTATFWTNYIRCLCCLSVCVCLSAFHAACSNGFEEKRKTYAMPAK